MKSDFTFAKDDAHRFLPWHIGIMVALATLLLSLVISLSSWVGTHEQDYSGAVTVIIPGSLEKLDDVTERVKTTISNDSAVANVKQVSESQLRGLLKPWIGDGDALFDMAMPVVLEINLKPKMKINEANMKNALAAIDPTIELDTHNSWAEVFAAFIRVLQWLGVMLVATIIGAMTLMITFSARASLHLHERTVSLLHGMGAEDGYIAKQFQNEHFRIGLKAAAIGVICAAVGFWVLSRAVTSINTPVLPNFAITQPHVALLFIMPVACAFVVLLATRYSVLAQLKKIL